MVYKYLTATILLWCILIGAFVVRLHGFTNPIADWHSWRQSDTSAVSWNFVEHGFDVLHPRFEDIANVQTGFDNPQGYRFVEFPIYNVLQAGLSIMLPFFTLVEWGRILTIFSSLLTTLFLYLIVRKHTNTSIALLTAFVYAFLPYDIYYGRTVLPDPSMIMTTFGALYFFDKALDEELRITNKELRFQRRNYINLFISLLFAAIALLLKPFAIFFFLPMFYIVWKRFGWKFILQWQLWVFAILAVIPLGLWRLWMTQYPQGIPVSAWLFNGGGIRFRPAFFRWMLYERLTKLFLGFAGLIPLFFGMYITWKGEKKYEFLKGQRTFYCSFILASILYVCVIARGNIQHDYYQIPVMPSVAMLVGLGSYYILQLKWFTKMVRSIVLLIIFAVSFWFSWQTVGHYFDIDNPSIIVAGKIVQELTPPDAKVIAPYGGDTTFLNLTDRKGWAEFEHPLPEMISDLGAQYMILPNPTPSDYNGFGKEYKIIAHSSQYLLLDLRQKQ